MALRYLLDTNICIYAISGRHPEVTRKLDGLAPGTAAISVVVLGELLYGAAKSARAADARLRLEALQQVVPVLDLPEAAAEHYGDIRAALERAGTPIGNNDLWIAAHARAMGLALITNNEREFVRVEKLRVDNWVGL